MSRYITMSRRTVLQAVTMIAGFTLAACGTAAREVPAGLYAEIVTNRGEILIRLEPERAPLTVMNFVGLAEGTIENSHAPGKPFYNGLLFHRVEPGFVIQGGDPAGNGTGGPGYRFPTETHPDLTHDRPGTVAMANSGPDTNGSQFYITKTATPHLDGGYNIFGEVVEGMSVVTAIQQGDRINEVRILRSGDAAAGYTATTERFRELIQAVADERDATRRRVQQDELAALRDRYPTIIEHEDGLLLARLQAGTGEPPRQGQDIEIHIVFSLPDGTQLDSTRDTNRPQRIVYLRDRLIRGLEMAVGTLRVGERTVAIVPPNLWNTGRPPAIPADSYVVFDIERLR
jgi:cyclophilin family peptidyl-prolyl cis-trans isomerase